MTQETWPLCKYVLKERAFIAPAPGKTARMMERGEAVEWGGKPGPHMEPTCDEGRAAMQLAGKQYLDPTRHLSLLRTPDADDLVSALLHLVKNGGGADLAGRFAPPAAPPFPVAPPAPPKAPPPPPAPPKR